ncbi:hypothetical protein HY745_03050 [Candidatus Desantisbacteria bacterium]|nr:hypothetical protein [Candidatus Desantisbacteria bacterium]
MDSGYYNFNESRLKKSIVIFFVTMIAVLLFSFAFSPGNINASESYMEDPSEGIVTAGDPIFISTRKFYVSVPFFNLGGPIPVKYSLNIPSMDIFASAFDNKSPVIIYTTGNYVTVEHFGHNKIAFSLSKSGNVWGTNSATKISYELKETDKYFYLMDPLDELIYIFYKPSGGSVSPQTCELVNISDRNGNMLTYITKNSNPVQISDGLGRNLNISYYNNPYSVTVNDGVNTDKFTPVPIETGTLWSIIVAGYYHTVGIKPDGTLWAWGRNLYGSLGDETNIDKTAPVQIGTGTTWSIIAAGSYHTVGLKSDKTLWTWGYNNFGQLGDGTAVDKTAPVQIGTETTWSAITAGASHTIGLKSDGTLWAWGYNIYGQLGDGTTINKTAPVQIGTETTWKKIAAGYNHTFGLKSDGTLWAWGYNNFGQLGDGTTVNKTAPVQIGTETTWKAIRAGSFHTVGLKSDGTLWAWGSNINGQLGDGTTGKKTAPVQIGTETTWSAIAAGFSHTVGLKSDGTLWAWGYNSNGQIGDGTVTDKTAPVQIGDETTWSAIAAGFSHTVGLKSDGTLRACGSTYYRQLSDPAGRSYILAKGNINNKSYQSITDPMGNTTKYFEGEDWYSGDDIKKIEKPLQNVPYTNTFEKGTDSEDTEYGKVKTQTDAYGNVTTFNEGTDGISVVSPDNSVKKYKFAGAPSSFIDDAGKQASFKSTGRGSISSIVDRIGDTTLFTYHPQSGMITSITNANKNKLSNTYTEQIYTFTNPANSETVIHIRRLVIT